MGPIFSRLQQAYKVQQHFSSFSVTASSALTRAESLRKLRISRNVNIAGVVLGLILTPLIIWYQVNKYNEVKAELDANHSDYYH